MYEILKDIRVLALEGFLSGPNCSMILADAGAEVIKIEQPKFGDPGRNIPPFYEDKGGEKYSGLLLRHNRGKKSLTLDLHKEEGKELFKKLAKTADVIVENLAPGTVEKLGLGYDVLSAINPRLIYCTISGFGRLDKYRGPYSKRGAFDPVLQAMGGFMALQQDQEGRPAHAGIPISDIVPPIMGAFGVMLALYRRLTTGLGDFVDISMYDQMVALNESPTMLYSMTGQVQKAGGVNPYLGPVGPYKCADGFVAFILPTNDMWARLCKAMGRQDLIDHPRTKGHLERVDNFFDFIRPAIEDWMADKTRQEVMAILDQAKVPVGPVQATDDLFKCPQVEARGMIFELVSKHGSKIKAAASPLKLGSLEEKPPGFPPALGEQTEEILKDVLGLSDEEVARLRQEEVI
ncbi:MAG: CoA transferase [Deltaproteobacteria bacterium]|nr:CoA transferase [Deltaproteobacteria bacterium]